MSEIEFPLTHEWLSLSHAEATEDARTWAVDSLASLAFDAGAERDALLAHLEAVAAHFLEGGGVGCLLLVPDGRLPVRALVRIDAIDGPSTQDEFRARCDEMIPPAPWLVDPVAVRTEDTEAGPATRMRVRFADPASAAAPARESVFWSWWFADVPETVVASVAFTDVVDSACWLDEVERVVAGARRTDGPVASPSGMPDGDYVG